MFDAFFRAFLSTLSAHQLVVLHNENVRDAATIRRELRARAALAELCNQSHSATVRRMKADGRWLGGPDEFGPVCAD